MKNIMHWKKSSPTHSVNLQNPFLSLQQEIDRTVNDFYNIFKTPFFSYSNDIEKLIINPSVDILEDDENFKVELEMPGVGEEDVKVSVNDRILSIKAKKETSKCVANCRLERPCLRRAKT